jgi:hypothetical protein
MSYASTEYIGLGVSAATSGKVQVRNKLLALP